MPEARNVTGLDPWLYSGQAGKLASVKGETWARRARDPASAVPAEGRRSPDTGRPQWLRSAVLAYVEQRDAKATPSHPAATQITHNAIVALLDGRRTEGDIAAELGVHVRTVHRHLSGECVCK